MPLLFIDYTDLVLKAYEEKRDSDSLPQRLVHPTTANIKQECLNTYTDRINKGEREEEDILRAFFGVPPAGKNFSYVIERFSPDRFRPIQSIIKRETKNPALSNVELLAWLIDFNPRPLSRAQKLLNDTSEPTDSNPPDDTVPPQPNPGPKSGTGNNDDEEDPVKPGGSKRDDRWKRVFVFFLMLIVSAGTIYALWQQKQDKQLVMGSANTGCMYWAGDHYDTASCTGNRTGRLVLPMDAEKMKNFKRITKEDTISEKSIGKIYYIKINGGREYYTTGGNHPVEVTRTLRVLSKYMYDKYLSKKDSLENGALATQNIKPANNR